MIGIINYGSGNISAIMNILKQSKIAHFLSNDPAELAKAGRYILPGVGAFDPTVKNLRNSGITDSLNEQVLGNGKKILGICVGMHLIAGASEEGIEQGLGWIPGKVRKLDASLLTHKPHLPHMGWNSISVKGDIPLFEGIDQERGFYFLHSYFYDAEHAEHVAATVEYGKEFPCVVNSDNVYGVQFHPEKSHSNGVRLLQNFARLV